MTHPRGLAPATMLASLLVLCSLLPAQTPAPDGAPFVHADGTTHWYKAVHVSKSGGITWDEAHAAALAAGGHLATINDAKENAFVFDLIKDPKFWDLNKGDGPWIGGLQSSGGTEPAGGWNWVEFEPTAYTNWAQGQPNNKPGPQADRMRFGSATTNQVADTWKDAPEKQGAKGYVIEWDLNTVPRTVGLQLDTDEKQPGYTLYAPLRSTEVYLIDGRGRPVHQWNSIYPPGASAYLLDNGDLIRAGNVLNNHFLYGGQGGVIERFDWAGKKVWEYFYSSAQGVMHHDFTVMPNGNILALVWYPRSKAECLAAGRDPAQIQEGRVCPDKVIEIKPDLVNGGGSIVWEWDPWDHLIQDFDKTKANYGDVGKHPERIDVNYNVMTNGDWMHTNAIHYNAKLDQVILSVRHFDELWIIDHSTTMAEAKTDKGGRSGKGGRLLYRWGNPAAYRQGTANDRRLFRQHDVQWIEPGLNGAGNILVFNNGQSRNWSSVDEIAPPTPDSKGNYPLSNGRWGPANPKWTWHDPKKELFAPFVSGAERQPNDNTLICYGALGRLIEVNPKGEVVWEMTSPLNKGQTVWQGDVISGHEVFRAPRYAPTHPGLKGRKLTPKDSLEIPSMGLLVEGSGADYTADLGEKVELEISAQLDQSGRKLHYTLYTSGKPGYAPYGTRAARIAIDPLIYISIDPSAAQTFQNYIGHLDTQARAKAAIQIPNIAVLSGLEVYTTFVIFDYQAGAPYNVAWNGSTVKVTIR